MTKQQEIRSLRDEAAKLKKSLAGEAERLDRIRSTGETGRDRRLAREAVLATRTRLGEVRAELEQLRAGN